MRLIRIEGKKYHVYEGRQFVMTLEGEQGATAAEVEWARLYATPAIYPTVETTTEETECL